MSIKIENSSSNFEVIRMPFTQYKTNLVDDKELSFNGKMYDIKSVQILCDSVEIVAINDVYEEKILEHIRGFIKNLGNFSHNTPIQFSFLVLLNYIIPDGSIKFHSPIINLCLFCYSDINYFSKKPDTDSPPPRSFLNNYCFVL